MPPGQHASSLLVLPAAQRCLAAACTCARAGGRAQKSLVVEGGAAFNGQALTKALKRRVGFVMQASART